MGTDISMYAEVRRNKQWIKVREKFINNYYNRDRLIDDWNKPYTDHPYDNRSYDLFAILADVRNGTGFAGCKTSLGFKPISEPRGLPEDVTDEVANLLDDFGYGYSFFTLKELKEYDWNQTVTHVGILSENEYVKMKDSGEHPTCWCGGIGGRDIITVNPVTMNEILDKKMDRNPELQYFVQTEFPTKTYKECCQYFIEDTIPELEALIPEDGTDEDVRILFAFD